MVDLEQLWLQVSVYEHIEAEYFEAHVVVHVIGLTRLVHVRQVGLRTDQRLDAQVLNGSFEALDILSFFFEVCPQPLHVPFGSSVHHVYSCVFLEATGVFVDGLVGQVHGQVVHVVTIGHFIRLCTQPQESVFMQPNSHRVASSQQNIQPQVELLPLHQLRLGYLSLYYAFRVRL